MPVTTKTATAVIALMIAAGAYPMTSMAQTETQSDQVEVEVIEQGAENAEQGVSETGEAIGQAAEGAAETVEQGVSEAGEAIGEAADSAGQAIEQGAEATVETVEQGAETTGEAVEEGAATTVEAVDQGAETTAETAETGAATTGETVETEVIEGDVESAGGLDDEQKLELEQAAAEGKPVPPVDMIMGVQQDSQWLSSDLIDTQVRSPEGEVIGDIGAILFSDQGPDGVVVEVGGFLGIGEKQVAIRWDELTITPDGIVLDTTEEQLKNAPEFVSLEEQQTQAELDAQQDQGMLTSEPAGTVGTMTEPAAEPMTQPEAEVEIQTEGDTTQTQ